MRHEKLFTLSKNTKSAALFARKQDLSEMRRKENTF